MADDLTSALIGLFGVVLGGGISSGVTYMLARSDRDKYARERIWEARRDVYTRLIAKAGEIERALEEHVLDFSDEMGGENYFGSAAYAQAEKRIVIMESQLDQLITLHRVIISKVIFEWHRALCVDLAEFVQYPERYEHHEIALGQHRIFEKETLRLMALAQGELGVKD